jgi:Ca2+-binding EF-hand superfamily protein
MGSVFGGGGGGGGPAPDTTTQFIREAPGIEERKLELMDLARQTAQSPISIPDIQVQGLSPLEQAAITQSGQTGIGAGTVQQGIGSIQGAQQTAALDPTSTQFQNYFNPYQSFITDEINRQAQMQQNQIANEAVMGGAFGGGREGVQRAELGGRTLSAIGQAQGNAFQNALNAFQQNQALQTQAGLQGGVQLGTLGQLQQEMAGTDIQRQLAAGGLERQLAQAELDAYRQTQLQRSAEPLQRLEFLSNIYAAGPKSTSGITAATLPQSSPLAQSIGTGLGVAQAYQGVAKAATGGLIEAANYRVKKFSTGGSVSNDDDESADLLNDEYTGSVPQYISPEQRRNLMLRPLTSQLLQATRRPGQSEASAVAGALGRGLEGQQDTALQLTKYDAAVKAAQEKAKGTEKSETGRLIPESEWRQIEAFKNLPVGSIVQQQPDGTYSVQRTAKGEADSRIATIESIQQIGKIRNLYEASGKPTGYFESSIKRTANKLFGKNPELAELDSTLELFNANFLKAMRGVQVSGIEQVKFEQILPNMNDAENVFEKKMDTVEEMLIIRDKLQNGEISREEFLDIVNNTYKKQKQKITSDQTKIEKDGSVTVSTGE